VLYRHLSVNVSLQGNTTAFWDWSRVFGDRTFEYQAYVELYLSRNQDLLLGATQVTSVWSSYMLLFFKSGIAIVTMCVTNYDMG